ncbi:MFS transporter [Corynebacterium sp. sy039]|uniref:MFS transporter n=1 Tax=Corynebacterium sp. sy039 TaxID=2599641 RepID=UPI001FEDB3FE|nr:MFS transporter [Corynebacterium sp. sy039]
MQKTSQSQRWIFLLIVSLGLFMVSADNSILFSALPTLRESLNTTELQGLWIVNAYPLVLAGLLIGTGTLGDKIGHRRMFEIGLIIFGIASLIAAFSPNAQLLITARALLGFGAATLMPATLALIRLTFIDSKERNTAIGIWGSIATIGAAAGPVLGGFLLENFWWGSVFLINIPIVVLTLFSTHIFAPENQADPQQSWDFLSSIWAMLAMTGFVFFIKELTHFPLNLLYITGSALLTLVSSWAFVHRQKHLVNPLLSFDIFRNRLFSIGVLSAALSMFIVAGTELLTTQRFQIALGFSPLQAGLITAAIALAAFPASILGGANLHRIGFRPIISGGFALVALGLFLGVYAIWNNLFALLIFGFITAGFGIGLIMSVASTAIIGSAPAHQSGMASAMEEVSYELGTVLSVALMGSLMSMFYTLRAPQSVAHSMDAGGMQAASAIDSAYATTLIITAIIAATTAIGTFIFFNGNPKETKYAHE